MNADIQTYNKNQPPERQEICEILEKEIITGLPRAECRLWHGAPVWFLDGNPVVGYHGLKKYVRLFFWSGQSFDEHRLINEGTFKAAGARFTNADQINRTDIQRWLKKSQDIQWDYKNLIKNGELRRMP